MAEKNIHNKRKKKKGRLSGLNVIQYASTVLHTDTTWQRRGVSVVFQSTLPQGSFKR